MRAETMSKDMDITGLFQLLDPASFPAQLQGEGLGSRRRSGPRSARRRSSR